MAKSFFQPKEQDNKMISESGTGDEVRIPRRGNISLGGNNPFAACYGNVGRKNY